MDAGMIIRPNIKYEVVMSFLFMPSWNSSTIDAERNLQENYLRDLIPNAIQAARPYRLVELHSNLVSSHKPTLRGSSAFHWPLRSLFTSNVTKCKQLRNLLRCRWPMNQSSVKLYLIHISTVRYVDAETVLLKILTKFVNYFTILYQLKSLQDRIFSRFFWRD
jgi:hypothetical protein